MPGTALVMGKIEFKKSRFFPYMRPTGTRETVGFLKKMSANLVQPFG